MYIGQVLFSPFRLLDFMERSNYLLLEADTFPAFQAVVTPYVHMGQKVASHVTVTVTDVGRNRLKSTLLEEEVHHICQISHRIVPCTSTTTNCSPVTHIISPELLKMLVILRERARVP